MGARVRHSAHGKGHEEGGSAYAKAGSSLRCDYEVTQNKPVQGMKEVASADWVTA